MSHERVRSPNSGDCASISSQFTQANDNSMRVFCCLSDCTTGFAGLPGNS